MARDGDGLFRRDGIWYFKYKDQSGVYREKSTGKRKQPAAREYKHDFLENCDLVLPKSEFSVDLKSSLQVSIMNSVQADNDDVHFHASYDLERSSAGVRWVMS